MRNEKGHIPYPNAAPIEELYRFGADGNLRMFSYDRLFFALYGYDAGTTRTYKYSFDLSPQWVNGRLESVNFNLHNAMFYPNSYLNFNQDGYYTKHYYNGMERIASRLGDNNLLLATHDPELQDRKWQLDSNIRRNIVGITGYEFLPVGEEQTIDDPKPIYELPVIGLNNLQPSADGIFYYHPNHLGSTCYVTDGNASVQQGFLYAPFGEITNEYNAGWQNGVLPKYSFNAKELDEETGMYYYEARYMAPPVFISRDRLFEKYPFMSPYAYCMNNPIKYIDPSGDSVVIKCDDAKLVAAAMKQMQSRSKNLTFYRNDNGVVGYKGEAKTKEEKYMVEIISNSQVIVNLQVKDRGIGFFDYAGYFMGNKFITDDKKKILANQILNIKTAADWDRKGHRPGNMIWHEIAEAFEGGLASISSGVEAEPSTSNEYPPYKNAHFKAGEYFPGSLEPYDTPPTKIDSMMHYINNSHSPIPIPIGPVKKWRFVRW